MNKLEVNQIISQFNGDYNDLYTKIIVINKEKTKFDKMYYDEIVYMSLFLFHLESGIENLSKRNIIPKKFGKVSSYEEFKSLLEDYKNIPYSSEYTPQISNLYEEIWRLAELKLLSRDDWTKMYASSIYSKELKEDGKIYLSVDNESLYQFATLLASTCLRKGMRDFEFKVNNNEEINRRDNIVIYFTNENLNDYLEIINEIKETHLELKFNQSHLLGYELDNHVIIAKDYKDGSSFTEKICKTIISLKQNGYTPEQITDLVENGIEQHLSGVLRNIQVSTKRKI